MTREIQDRIIYYLQILTIHLDHQYGHKKRQELMDEISDLDFQEKAKEGWTEDK